MFKDVMYPPVNFRFEVTMETNKGEYYFSKVSGIEMKLNVTPLPEGGNNNTVHKLPGATEYTDLSLHHGLVSTSSSFFIWCQNIIKSDYTNPIVPEKLLIVRLLDEEDECMVYWEFTNAYPISLKVGDLDAQNQAVLIEELSFTYSEFERKYP
ncbi:MAG: phage tail protein [Flavobacteriales bacterium]|jgi:phage tail-like protein|nr:phage tail protein [Flavobacteriales bacterium]MBT6916011.1 phage tail protein [Flavobacteriales bacterium]MBT7749436.1 phage tail protein [Flavobacteriales bacterium]